MEQVDNVIYIGTNVRLYSYICTLLDLTVQSPSKAKATVYECHSSNPPPPLNSWICGCIYIDPILIIFLSDTRSKKWVINLRREDLRSKDAASLYKSYTVCQVNYEEVMFMNAVETKSLVSLITEGNPQN